MNRVLLNTLKVALNKRNKDLFKDHKKCKM